MKGVSKKKGKKAAKKPKVHNAVLVEQQEYFQVYVEQPARGGPRTAAVFTNLVDEDTARKRAEALRDMGVGGFILKFDGTPDGVTLERWVGVDAVVEAQRVEDTVKN